MAKRKKSAQVLLHRGQCAICFLLHKQGRLHPAPLTHDFSCFMRTPNPRTFVHGVVPEAREVLSHQLHQRQRRAACSKCKVQIELLVTPLGVGKTPGTLRRKNGHRPQRNVMTGFSFAARVLDVSVPPGVSGCGCQAQLWLRGSAATRCQGVMEYDRYHTQGRWGGNALAHLPPL